MIKNCINCRYSEVPLFAGPCNECKDEYSKWEERVQTNADRIRAMSDEELAGLMFDLVADCQFCPAKDRELYCLVSKETCRSAWCDWLKREATE